MNPPCPVLAHFARAGAILPVFAGVAANCWGESYGIDAWGNLNSIASLSSAYTGCAQEPGFSTTANARNQLPLTGNAYDSAGNVITAPVGGITNSYSYNADNQMLSMTGLTTTTNYVYDGDGKRVQKTGSKLYWYGADGAVLDETDTTGSVTNANFSEYIFVGGRRMARRDSAGNVLYYFADHLGTSRTMAQVASGQTTATLCYDADFYPFGGERTVVNLCGQNYKFTGKERDQESGLDEFGARYYASAFGRFMIPDWAEKPTDVPYANFGNPQTLNLYSYVQNNPLAKFDDDGHVAIEIRYTPTFIGNHSYLLVTDTNGAKTFFRAGPAVRGATENGVFSSSGSSSQQLGSNSVCMNA